MTPTIAKLISECVTPFVSVSIDGSEAETHEWLRKVPGCFEKSLSGIRILVDAGFKPQMIMMVMPHNKHQMESAVRMAEALGCGSVKFNLVNPTSRGMLVRDKGQTLSLEEYIEVGEWVERELVPSSSIGIYYSHPFAFVPLSNMYGRQKDPRGACGISGVIGVLSDGNYALCGIGESVKDLVFGNATEVPLAKVWAENPVILDIRKKFPRELKGLCGRCAMLDTCLGFCIAHNYFASKDLWSGFWYCHEAHQKGLFPVNRLRPDKNLV
jgi:SynChlorMet cassette radical SAM/SPASM protein ScmF